MAVRKDSRDGTWRYRIKVKLPNGETPRISGTPELNTRAAAEMAESISSACSLRHPRTLQKKEVPTLKKFADEFMETYITTNNKPSEIESKRMILRLHLTPFFGSKRLDQIGQRDVRRTGKKKKAENGIEGLSPKTVNNCLTVVRRCSSSRRSES